MINPQAFPIFYNLTVFELYLLIIYFDQWPSFVFRWSELNCAFVVIVVVVIRLASNCGPFSFIMPRVHDIDRSF